jgi:hypothetical protein
MGAGRIRLLYDSITVLKFPLGSEFKGYKDYTAHCPFQEEISLIAQRLTNTSQTIFS